MRKISDEIRRQFSSRVALAFTILVAGLAGFVVYSSFAQIEQLEQIIKRSSETLTDNVVSEFLAQNEGAVELLLEQEQSTLPIPAGLSFRLREVEDISQGFSYSPALNWQYSAGVRGFGKNFGVLTYQGSLLSMPTLLRQVFGAIVLSLLFTIIVWLVLGPLASKIPSQLFARELELLKSEVLSLTDDSESLVDRAQVVEVRDVLLNVQRMKADLRKLEEEKVELARTSAVGRTVQALAHDVRKPFTLFRVIAEGMRQISDTDELRSFVGGAVFEVERAMASVDGLLEDVMQIGGGERIDVDVVSLESIANEALREVFGPVEDSDVEIVWRNPDKLLFKVDARRIRRVFSNIFLNAAQAMSFRGHLSVEVMGAREDRRLGEVSILNTGSLIPESQLEKLFDLFFTSKKTGGTGLGLAIAKKWAAAHGGSIRCESSVSKEYPEGYVRFVMSLPLADGARLQETEPKPEVHSKHYTMRIGVHSEDFDHETEAPTQEKHSVRIKVSVVDDEEIYLGGVKRVFDEVIDLEDENALQLMTDPGGVDPKETDLILVDYDLGNRFDKGSEWIQRWRASGSKAVICLHTNRYDREVFDQALKAGADLVLPKPLGKEHLLKVLAEIEKTARSSNDTPQKVRIAMVEDSLATRLVWKSGVDRRVDLSLFERPEDFFESSELFDVVLTDLHFDNSPLTGEACLKHARKVGVSKILLFSNSDEFDSSLFDGRIAKETEPGKILSIVGEDYASPDNV